MTGFCDIHAHCLPGIDDGPGDVGLALDMLRSAAASGITTIAATPHLRSDFPDVRVAELADRRRELADQAQGAGIVVEIVNGGEVSIGWALDASDEELALASYGQRGTDLLIESPHLSNVGLDVALYEMRSRGYRIILAHPERTGEFQDDASKLAELVHQGVVIQINAESLLGDGRKSGSSRLGRRLCAEGLAHVLASDSHRAESWRPVTSLARGVEAAAALVGPKRAQWMAQSAPAAVLEGRPLPEPPPIVAPPRGRRLWSRWRGVA